MSGIQRAFVTWILLVVMSYATGCASVRHVPSIESQVRDLAPALRIEFEASASNTPPAFELRRFSFSPEPPHKWPYGTGFAVADRASRVVLWVYLHNGDFAPHKIRWLDFDGDGREDIFFHAGFEDVSTTHLFFNRVRSTRYGVSHFAEGYSNSDVYAVVVDLDGDGRPELIAPDGDASEDDPCAIELHQVAASSAAWKEEYWRVVGRFDSLNFQYGASAAEYDALRLFSKPQIVSFGPRPKSDGVVRHLELRERLVTAFTATLSAQCRPRATEVAAHLMELVRDYEHPDE